MKINKNNQFPWGGIVFALILILIVIAGSILIGK